MYDRRVENQTRRGRMLAMVVRDDKAYEVCYAVSPPPGLGAGAIPPPRFQGREREAIQPRSCHLISNDVAITTPDTPQSSSEPVTPDAAASTSEAVNPETPPELPEWARLRKPTQARRLKTWLSSPPWWVQSVVAALLNLPEWRAHILERLHRQVQATRDPRLAELLAELSSYPGDAERPELTDVAVPLRLRHDGNELAFFSMTAVVGAPLDVTVAEVAIESFYPADADTAEALQAMRG
jgi:hypothetical protein